MFDYKNTLLSNSRYEIKNKVL